MTEPRRESARGQVGRSHTASRSEREKPMAESSPTTGPWEPQPEQTHLPGVQQAMEDPISKNRLYSFSFGQQCEQTTIVSLCEAHGLVRLIKEAP